MANGKAGRPKGSVASSTLIAQKMRQVLVKTVNKKFKPIIDAQIDLASGIVVKQKVKLPNGKTFEKYYQTKPDVLAAKNLIEQAIGKPKESVEHSGSIKNITEVIARLESEDSVSDLDKKH